MEKLNALVKLAKKATSGEWCAFISMDGDGTFSIHTPEDGPKGDIVNWPGFDTANYSKSQKKANAKFIAASNPQTIFAIAYAFRALEQRAEAAEAKLAELESIIHQFGRKQGVSAMQSAGLVIATLSERPAPAADLAGLVPGSIEPEDVPDILDPTSNPDEYACCVGRDMWEACRAAILRNIEEAK